MHFLGIWELLVQQMGTRLMVKAAYGPIPYCQWITQLKHLNLPSLTFDPALNFTSDEAYCTTISHVQTKPGGQLEK